MKIKISVKSEGMDTMFKYKLNLGTKVVGVKRSHSDSDDRDHKLQKLDS